MPSQQTKRGRLLETAETSCKMASKTWGMLSVVGIGAAATVWACKSGAGSPRCSEDETRRRSHLFASQGIQATTGYCKEVSDSLPASSIAAVREDPSNPDLLLHPQRGALPRRSSSSSSSSSEGIPHEVGGAVERCRVLVRRVMMEQGVPGAVVAVAKDGKIVWSEGMGLADVENDTPCTNQSG